MVTSKAGASIRWAAKVLRRTPVVRLVSSTKFLMYRLSVSVLPVSSCTEKAVAFRVPIFDTVDIHGITPPDTYPGINARVGSVGTVAAAIAGAVAGGIGAASWRPARNCLVPQIPTALIPIRALRKLEASNHGHDTP